MEDRYVVTIQRQFGSLGRPIAKKMAEILGIDYYDRDIVELAAKKMNLPISIVGNMEETVSSSFFRMKFPLGDGDIRTQTELFEVQKKIITDIADREPCIIVGRCSDYILRDYKNCIHIFIYAPFEARFNNCVNNLNIAPGEAKKLIQDVDRARANYHRYFTKTLPQDIRTKSLLIDSSLLGPDGTAALLVDAVKRKFAYLFH